MKAVILAGGEGSRLRPLTLGRPKPMTPLFGKPVLGHILDLLRRHGITQVAVTLGYLPAVVTDYFGDGAEYGMELRCFVEREPLGTAGGVKRCMDFLGEEDFLVISGDAVCDLDLTAFAARHRESGAVASLVLCRREQPLEYGLVRTDKEGRVLGFVEKPGWGQVDTELVNTGIYLLSKRAMDLVPEKGPCDFGKELFPKLLERGEQVRGWEVPGYWQDMGDCGAYLESLQDALAGKVSLDLDRSRETAPPAAGVDIRPPCWIGTRASLAPGCTIGPYTVVGEGSSVETGAVVERSALLGAHVGEGAEVHGAVLCKGASVHSRAMVNPGAVLGEDVRIGAEAIVAPGVKLWPGRGVEEGGKATTSQVTAGAPAPVSFSPEAVLRGVIGETLTAEGMVALGSLLGEKGRVGLGWSGGEGAGMLCRALGCGVAAAGGQVLTGDGACPAAQSWLGRYYALPVSAFVRQDGESAEVQLFGPDGLPLERRDLRKLEGGLLRGEGTRAGGGRTGSFETVTGVHAGYVREAVRLSRLGGTPLRPVEVQVERGGEVNGLLAGALAVLGCRVSRGRGKGRPTFSADWGGFRLGAWDEEGNVISTDRLLVLLTRIELEHGAERVGLPPWAPAAAEEVAGSLGGTLLRLGRDGEEARALWRDMPWLWDAVFGACRLCARMALTGESLTRLDKAIPQFSTVRGEVPLRTGRGRVMGAVTDHPAARSQGEGVRIPAETGWVYLVPVSSRRALRIIAEASSMEAAEELCKDYEEKIRSLDGA